MERGEQGPRGARTASSPDAPISTLPEPPLWGCRAHGRGSKGLEGGMASRSATSNWPASPWCPAACLNEPEKAPGNHKVVCQGQCYKSLPLGALLLLSTETPTATLSKSRESCSEVLSNHATVLFRVRCPDRSKKPLPSARTAAAAAADYAARCIYIPGMSCLGLAYKTQALDFA